MRYVSSSGSLPIDYKNGNRETIEGVGWNFILRIQFTVDVSYYSVGGPNHSKTLCLLFIFDQKIFLFISASHSRGADHEVGSNLCKHHVFSFVGS